MKPATATIVDYGLGNLLSVRSAIEAAGGTALMSNDPDTVMSADRIVLPGVGAFKDAMDDMHSTGLVEPFIEFAKSGRPVLGICLGAQMLLSKSEEFGLHEGLGLISGSVVKLPELDIDGQQQRIPHVGWEALHPAKAWDNSVLKTLTPGVDVYFVHSFHPAPDDPNDVLGTCEYGGHAVNAAISHDNVWGCQFHPEKSADAGLTILRNFLAI